MLGGAGVGGEQLVTIGVNGAKVFGEFERACVDLCYVFRSIGLIRAA